MFDFFPNSLHLPVKESKQSGALVYSGLHTPICKTSSSVPVTETQTKRICAPCCQLRLADDTTQLFDWVFTGKWPLLQWNLAINSYCVIHAYSAEKVQGLVSFRVTASKFSTALHTRCPAGILVQALHCCAVLTDTGMNPACSQFFQNFFVWFILSQSQKYFISEAQNHRFWNMWARGAMKLQPTKFAGIATGWREHESRLLGLDPQRLKNAQAELWLWFSCCLNGSKPLQHPDWYPTKRCQWWCRCSGIYRQTMLYRQLAVCMFPLESITGLAVSTAAVYTISDHS